MGVKSAQPSSTPCFLCFLQKHICWCMWKIATLTQDYTRFKNVLSAKYSEAKMYSKIVWISAALSTSIFEPLWSLYHGKKIGENPRFCQYCECRCFLWPSDRPGCTARSGNPGSRRSRCLCRLTLRSHAACPPANHTLSRTTGWPTTLRSSVLAPTAVELASPQSVHVSVLCALPLQHRERIESIVP